VTVEALRRMGDQMGACELRHFVRPCLLLLLRQQPDHGYDLAQRLVALGIEPPDAGTVYRALRALEADGLVTSVWVPPESGPARRIYRLTEAGGRALADEVRELAGTRATVDRFLRAYAQGHLPGAAVDGNGRVDPLLGPHVQRARDAAGAPPGRPGATAPSPRRSP
jgi:PadR family transcriptional regulator, regulatory protein PadR